ncbi:MAG: acetyl-CoA carboxylase carboxyltransferase subunit alpha [Herpetosiphonaceae bacterium]|nr:acetyl-CoA carboxylase carboxyltransferase subunit alpha [Herpetosiphonaceae bacterium]
MLPVAPSTTSLAAWDKVQLARHRYRPHTLDYIHRLCSDFIELRGDRSFGDDQALLGGVGRTALGSVVVMGHQKGRDTRENVRHNFGMPHPEGYRKALRLMRHAEKFAMPLICFIDTPGAQPDLEAEARGQAQAIADCLLTLARLRVPIIAIVIGEGGSGGALAIGLGDRVLMLEHAIYSVAAPEASAAILWHDAGQAAEAAHMMKITAQDLSALGVIDEIVPEPSDGAHTDPEQMITTTLEAVMRNLHDLRCRDPQHLLWERYARYRTISCFQAG